VKLDDERDLREEAVIQSNHSRDGRVYLLNVPPGDYVAVAAFTAKRPPSAPDYGRLCTTSEIASAQACYEYYSYFPKDLIELTRVSVGRGQFAFAGSYVIDNTPGLGNADPVQLHYAEVIAPGVRNMGPGETIREAAVEALAKRRDFPGHAFHYRGSVHEAGRDDNARSEFLVKARQDLTEGGWSAIVK
jgi:hypothetical protein